MTVRPATEAALFCDACGKEIKRGATTLNGWAGTFLRIDSADNMPLFKDGDPTKTQQFHLSCLTVRRDMAEALAHAVKRDHPWSTYCDGCKDIDRLLDVNR